MRLKWLTGFALLFGWPAQAMAVGCLEPAGGLDGSGTVNVVDMQCGIMTNLYAMAGGFSLEMPSCIEGNLYRADTNCNGDVRITDVMVLLKLAFEPP